MVKISKVSEIPAEILNRAKRIRLVNEKTGANRFGILLITVEPGAPPHVQYHFHKKKESAYFVIQGMAKMIIEDKEYVITPDMIVFIPPGEKHQIFNIGKTELKVIEVLSPLPLGEDSYTV